MHRILFICSQNRLRSPTAEQVFATWPDVETASAGLNENADIPVSPELLAWATTIFVMEKSHRSKLTRKFRAHINSQRLICLNIPDDFEYMDERLVKMLKSIVPRHLGFGAMDPEEI